MGIFDFFKKKEETRHYDPIDITVRDLGKGYIFEYDLKTWTVEAVYEYDWGDNFYTREFLIKSGDQVKYLEIEEDGDLIVTLSEKVKYRKLGEDVCDYIDKKEKPPKKLTFEGTRYYLDEKSAGFIKEIDSENWQELISYDYLDEEEEKTLTIEQYSETSYEVTQGEVIKSKEISNILPVDETT